MTMLTGRHPASCPDRIPEGVPTVAGLLAEAGYHTAALGKMHMIPPRGPYGFAELALSEDTGEGMFLDDYHRWLAEQGTPSVRPYAMAWLEGQGLDVIKEHFDVAGRAASAIEGMDLPKVHHMINDASARHLGAIQVLGYILGFIAGALLLLV